MKVLTTEEAIEMVDNNVEVSFEEISNKWYLQLSGEEELMNGEDAIKFTLVFLENYKMFETDEDKINNITEAINNKILKGYSLNIIIAQCKGVIIN